MCKRKKTVVHGTLEMIPLAWKFNFKQLLSKTLNSRMNIIETRAVFNVVKTDGKCFYIQFRQSFAKETFSYDETQIYETR